MVDLRNGYDAPSHCRFLVLGRLVIKPAHKKVPFVHSALEVRGEWGGGCSLHRLPPISSLLRGKMERRNRWGADPQKLF